MNYKELHWLDELKLTLKWLGYFNHPVSEAELVRLENVLGVLLPSEYREFLARIGYGAGPHPLWSPETILAELGHSLSDQDSLPEESANQHDLRLLLEASETLEDLRMISRWDNVEAFQKEVFEYKRQHPGPPFPNQPFHFTKAQAEEYNCSVPEESVRPWLFGLYPANGSIAIADDGEVVYYALVVTGDVAGSVWEITGEFLTSWRPARRPPSGRNPLPALSATPTFLEWYCSWIEQCLVNRCVDPGGFLDLALRYQKMGKYVTAVENWDKAIEITLGNSIAYYYRGLALQGLQQMADATADFKRCLVWNPDPWTRARAEVQLGELGVK